MYFYISLRVSFAKLSVLNVLLNQLQHYCQTNLLHMHIKSSLKCNFPPWAFTYIGQLSWHCLQCLAPFKLSKCKNGYLYRHNR